MSNSSRLQKIIKQKDSALAVFENARQQLEKVVSTLLQEERASRTRIAELSENIRTEEEHINSVLAEVSNANSSIQKIESILK